MDTDTTDADVAEAEALLGRVLAAIDAGGLDASRRVVDRLVGAKLALAALRKTTV